MTGLVDSILGIIGTIIYPLFGVIYSVIDLVERIFRAFAGTETVYVSGDQVTSGNTGADTDTGIVYYLLRSDLVRNMFLAMLYLAIILLVVFTIMAVLKNMYQPQPKKWQDIIASAIKGLGLFIIVPACSLLAVWVGNILLVAIDGATSGSNSSATMSGRLFIAASYTSNYIRSDAEGIDQQKYNEVAALCDRCGIEIRAFQPTDGGLDTDYEYYASLVDDCFASEAMSAARCNWGDVNAHYAIIHINFLTLAAGGIFMLYVLGSISFGMVKRLFMLVILFIISPVVCSMYPIDEGSAYKSWFGEFKKNLLSAYGAVAGMNLFLTIMPIVDQIQLGGANGDWVGLLQLILVIAGLFVVKDVISFISGLAGGDNSYSGGNSLFVSVRGKAKSGLGKIGSGATKLRHGGSMAYQASKAAKASGGSGTAAFFRQAGSSVLSSLNSGLSKTTGLDFSGIVKGGASKDEISKIKDREAFNKMAQVQRAWDKGDTSRFSLGANGEILERRRKVDGPGYENVQILSDLKGESITGEDGTTRYRINDSEMLKASDKLGYGAGAKSSVAKKYNQKSYEDLTSAIEHDTGLAKEIDRTGKERADASTKFNNMLNQATLEVDGLDVRSMSTDEFNTLQSRMKNNQKWSGDDISYESFYSKISEAAKKNFGVDSLSYDQMMTLQKQARTVVEGRQAENQAVENFQAAKLELQNADKAFNDARIKAQDDQKLGTFKFDKSDIQAQADATAKAIKENDNVAVNELSNQTKAMKDLENSIKNDVVKAIEKEVGNPLKRLAKTMEDSKKSNEGKK